MYYMLYYIQQLQHNTTIYKRKDVSTMKHTKNMYYEESTESRELFLYATNNGNLYEQAIIPIINNLRKKAEKGLYDSEKAIDAWYPVATMASDKYKKDFGYSFTVQERYTVAVDMEECYREEIFFELNK